jgi:uncharacterized protein
MTAVPSLPLEGLYLHLVRSGFPLSVRDFEDALLALRAGHGLHRRDELRRLCKALWARTEPELAQIDRLFEHFPWPSAEEIRKATGRATGELERSSGPDPEGLGRALPPDSSSASPRPALAFVAPDQSGIGLPRARVPALPDESYVMSPRPAIPLRSLIVALRRYRLAQRSGPRTEIDIPATITEQCRRGTLIEPVLLPARRNQARLLVLVDASPSMTPWRHMHRLLREALERSQLASTGLYFFDNVPADDLYEQDSLTRPLPLKSGIERYADHALLVVGDAGAVRGASSRERIARTRAFVERVRPTWREIAWLNPMPRKRWMGTSAGRVERLQGVAMTELTDDGLTFAVDYLRGKRTS